MVQSPVKEDQEQYDTIEFELVDFDSQGNVVKLDHIEETNGKLHIHLYHLVDMNSFLRQEQIAKYYNILRCSGKTRLNWAYVKLGFW